MTEPTYHHGHLREALLDAGRALLAEGGLSALSLRELARRVGVSPAAPYHHFRDKAELVAALVEDGLRRLEQASVAALRDGATPIERLRAIGVAYVTFAVTHPAEFRLLFRPELGRIPDPPDLERAPVFRVLISVVDDLERPVGLDRFTAAVAAWSLVHGLAALLVDGPLLPLASDHRQVERLANAVTAQLFV